MVASHHAELWQQQRSQPTYHHMSNIGLTGLMPPFESPRPVTNPPTSRGYHQTTSNVEMSMPLFSTNSMSQSMPYQSSAFAFDPLPVNPYNMQQAYPVGYAADVPQNISYTRSSVAQQMPVLQEARTPFTADQRSIKSATASPLQSSSPYYGSPYGPKLERTQSEPTEGTSINFSTDVDTLMKAIQAKQPESQPTTQTHKVRSFGVKFTKCSAKEQ